MDRKTYTFDEAFKASLDYFTGDELAAKVWVNKYALKDAFGNIYEESPNDMHHRLASEIARVEKKYPNPLSEQELFDLFDHFRYIVPQGSPMTGIGNDFQIASLSNCFVIGLDGQADSYGAIIRIDEEQVQLMKRRGGVGHDLSHIRPKGSPVKNSALTSTGLVPFMERSSAVFIESEELYCNAEKRLESVIARLEENGNEVHVIRAGTVPLLQIDNLYYECIPTQHKYYRVPVFGVQLRRYIM